MKSATQSGTTTLKAAAHSKLAFNVDVAAIVIALTFAALIRLNIIPHITW